MSVKDTITKSVENSVHTVFAQAHSTAQRKQTVNFEKGGGIKDKTPSPKRTTPLTGPDGAHSISEAPTKNGPDSHARDSHSSEASGAQGGNNKVNALKYYHNMPLAGEANLDDPMPTAVQFDDILPYSTAPNDEQIEALKDYADRICDVLNDHDTNLEEGTAWELHEGILGVYNENGECVKRDDSVTVFPNDIRAYCEKIGSPLTNNDAIKIREGQMNLNRQLEQKKEKWGEIFSCPYALTKEGLIYAGPINSLDIKFGLKEEGKDYIDLSTRMDYQYTPALQREAFEASRNEFGLGIGYDAETTMLPIEARMTAEQMLSERVGMAERMLGTEKDAVATAVADKDAGVDVTD